jgi:hypothetical protein
MIHDRQFVLLRCEMTADDISEIPDDCLFELSLVRGGLHMLSTSGLTLGQRLKLFVLSLTSRGPQILQLIKDKQGKIVNHSKLSGQGPRYPFMGVADSQVGFLWTDPELRGSGVTTWALGRLKSVSSSSVLWWVVPEHNFASRAVGHKMGFEEVARLRKSRIFGVYGIEIDPQTQATK